MALFKENASGKFVKLMSSGLHFANGTRCYRGTRKFQTLWLKLGLNSEFSLVSSTLASSKELKGPAWSFQRGKLGAKQPETKSISIRKSCSCKRSRGSELNVWWKRYSTPFDSAFCNKNSRKLELCWTIRFLKSWSWSIRWSVFVKTLMDRQNCMCSDSVICATAI